MDQDPIIVGAVQAHNQEILVHKLPGATDEELEWSHLYDDS